MKAVYILFSGGYDSSYLVNKVLQEIKDTEEEISCVKKFNDGRYLGLNDIIVTYDNENTEVGNDILEKIKI